MSDLAGLFRDNVIKAMAAKDWSQRDLAEACGMLQPGINRYLTGKSEPGIEIIARVSKALDLQPWQLLKPSDAKESPLIVSIIAGLSALDDEKLRAILTMVRAFGSSVASVKRLGEK